MATTPALNSLGELFTIRHADQTVQIWEVGASLFSYTVGEDVVAGGPTPTPGTDVYKGSRGAVLIPFPNRVREGKYEANGTKLQLPINEVATGHASHGFARFQRWSIEARTESGISLSCLMPAQLGYPFVLEAFITYELSATGLCVSMTVKNRGTTDAPVVMGTHLYFTVGSHSLDNDQLTVFAQKFLPLDDTMIPTGEHADVDGSDVDFRTARALKGASLDVCYTELDRDEQGVARILLESTETNRSVEVWMDETFPFAQLFTADTLGNVDDRRKTIAIEPMTGAPNAFNNGDGLQVLAPGARLQGTWGVRPFER